MEEHISTKLIHPFLINPFLGIALFEVLICTSLSELPSVQLC